MNKIVAIWGRDDFNTGTAPNDAFRSIQAGINSASSTDTVEVYTGKYTESLFQNTQTVMSLAGIGLVRVVAPSPTAYFLDANDRSISIKNFRLEDF